MACITTPKRKSWPPWALQRGHRPGPARAWWSRETRSSCPTPATSPICPGVRLCRRRVRAGAHSYAEDRLPADPRSACAPPSPRRTKALILPYPNNPTGAVMRREDLEALAEVLRGTDIVVISDEIYSELTYGDAAHVSFASIAGMWERTVTLNGFSKAFAMTGWRLGYACAPQAPFGRDAENPSVYHACAPPTPFSARGGGGPAHRFRTTIIADVRKMVESLRYAPPADGGRPARGGSCPATSPWARSTCSPP